MKPSFERCVNGLMIAVAAIAVASSAFATADPWFDGGIAEGWPNASGMTMNGTWCNQAADLAKFVAASETKAAHLAVSTGNSSLGFEADETHDLSSGSASVHSEIAFTPFEFDELSVDLTDVKAGLTLVKDASGNYAFYGIAKVNSENGWVKLRDVSAPPSGFTVVDIGLTMVQGVTKVTYVIDGVACEAMEIVVADELSGVEYRGKGEVSVVSAMFEGYVAEINGEKFSTFSEAYAAAKAGDAINLLASVRSFVPPPSIAVKTVSVNRNGHEFNVSVDQAAYSAKGLVFNVDADSFGVALPFAGSGVSDNPYIIADANALALFQRGVNAGSYGFADEHFALTGEDVVLEDWEGVNGFAGVFDGAGARIMLSLKSTAASGYRGLFNSVIGDADHFAVVRNLKVKLVDWDQNGAYGLAAVAGEAAYAEFANCQAEAIGSLSVSHASAGVCARVSRSAKFSNCVNLIAIESNGASMGGIVGVSENVSDQMRINLSFDGCTNYGNLASLSDARVGVAGVCGNVGQRCDAFLRECSNNGSIVGKDVGQIVGVCNADASVNDQGGNVVGHNVLAVGGCDGAYDSVFSGFKFGIEEAGGWVRIVADSEIMAASVYIVEAPIATFSFELAELNEWITFDASQYPAFAATVTARDESSAAVKVSGDAPILTYLCVSKVLEVVPGGAPQVVEADSAEEAVSKVVVRADRPAEVTDAIVDAAAYKLYFKAVANETSTPGVFNVVAVMNEAVVKPADTLKEIADNLSDLTLVEGKLEVSGKPGLYYYVEETGVLNDPTHPFVENEAGAGMAGADGKVRIPMTKFDDAGFYRLGVRTSQKPLLQ